MKYIGAGKGGAARINARKRRQEQLDAWVGPHEENTRMIPIAGGLFAKVDAENFEQLNQWNWLLSEKGYAYRFSNGRGSRRIRMHQDVLACRDGYHPDHKNRDTLDNRESNLRPSNNSQNLGNRWKPKNMGASSVFKGVYWAKHCNKWAVCAGGGRNKKYLGLFDFEVDAAKAYNQWAVKHFGEFALLNPV